MEDEYNERLLEFCNEFEKKGQGEDFVIRRVRCNSAYVIRLDTDLPGFVLKYGNKEHSETLQRQEKTCCYHCALVDVFQLAFQHNEALKPGTPNPKSKWAQNVTEG